MKNFLSEYPLSLTLKLTHPLPPLISPSLYYYFKGESQPADYTHEVAAKHISLLDARNVAFRGSYCIEGDAIGVVIRTGTYTVLYNNAYNYGIKRVKLKLNSFFWKRNN